LNWQQKFLKIEKLEEQTPMSDLNKVFVVPVKLEPHPNADSLSIVRVFDFYTVVVRTEDWKDKDRGAWIPPDNVVPDNELFAFLKGKTHIKECKLRGVLSQGLLVPVPDSFEVGMDVTDFLGVKRYVHPKEQEYSTKGLFASPPPVPGPTYDLESWLKYGRLIPDGTKVFITEKIDGTNSRFTYQEGKFHVASRNNYRKEGDPNCIYWKAFREFPWIGEFCRTHPNMVLYGEIFGYKVQKLSYDKDVGVIDFRAFDVFDPAQGRFLDFVEFVELVTENGKYPDRVVPVIAEGPHTEEFVKNKISGKSMLASHNREGVVVRPEKEMYNQKVGRLVLKAVSERFLNKKEKK
jgi:RNA ligase (TIGR02306 family)